MLCTAPTCIHQHTAVASPLGSTNVRSYQVSYTRCSGLRRTASTQAQGVGGGRLKYCSMTDVIVKTVKHEGFLGLYKVFTKLTYMAANTSSGCTPPLRCACAKCWLVADTCTCCSQGVIPNLFKLAPAAGISWFTFEVTPMLCAIAFMALCSLGGTRVHASRVHSQLLALMQEVKRQLGVDVRT